ncbi:recombinase family protein [Methylobacterium sp. 10]|uniref:recombinase family protein n=1 Tax=Methylobacterium sp. 10 TaxID=1101191 RepID=UPI0004B008A5|nr:recombinase family protein [Methylobacterium sp. 10]
MARRASRQSSAVSTTPPAHRQLRAVAYTRVSTGPQAEADLSLPDQRNQIAEWCLANDHVLVGEYEERGASATSEKGRPQLAALLERACDGSRPFDLIVVHSFSRFFRNNFLFEGVRRRLKKHDVRVVLMTQPFTEEDSAHVLARNIFGLFDKYQSQENSKHVLRSMKENARQGYWNGSMPPFGYRTIETEQKGKRLKKILAIDPVEAELVRLIYRLIGEGDGRSGPLGVKSVCNWLNERGHVTRTGARWGIGPLHDILTRPLYAGTYQFNRREAKTRQLKAQAEVIESTAPVIVTPDLYQAVQDPLRSRRPSEAPPREVTVPILLTGIAKWAACGGGMTLRTGTSSTGRVYRYYTCSPAMRMGKRTCPGTNIAMTKLDDLVTTALVGRLLTTDRVQEILSGLVARRQSRVGPAQARIQALATEEAEAEVRLKRLYASIEAGVADLSD